MILNARNFKARFGLRKKNHTPMRQFASGQRKTESFAIFFHHGACIAARLGLQHFSLNDWEKRV